MLALGGHVHGFSLTGAYLTAFVAGCLVDLLVSTVREAFSTGLAPRLQLRVIASVWLVDACFAPLGLLIARAAREQPALLILMLPLTGLLRAQDIATHVRELLGDHDEISQQRHEHDHPDHIAGVA